MVHRDQRQDHQVHPLHPPIRFATSVEGVREAVLRAYGSKLAEKLMREMPYDKD